MFFSKDFNQTKHFKSKMSDLRQHFCSVSYTNEWYQISTETTKKLGDGDKWNSKKKKKKKILLDIKKFVLIFKELLFFAAFTSFRSLRATAMCFSNSNISSSSALNSLSFTLSCSFCVCFFSVSFSSEFERNVLTISKKWRNQRMDQDFVPILIALSSWEGESSLLFSLWSSSFVSILSVFSFWTDFFALNWFLVDEFIFEALSLSAFSLSFSSSTRDDVSTS